MRNSLLSTALTVLAVGAFFYGVLALPGLRKAEPQIHSLQGSTMGTTWEVQVVTAESRRVQVVATEIGTLLAQLDRGVFSTWSANSELSQLNRSPVQLPQALSPALRDVLLLAQAIHARSRGAYDISIGPLVQLWGFGPEPVTGIPDVEAIAKARAGLGLEAMEVNSSASTVSFARPLNLDLSGIAKGYAADAVAKLLQDLGFSAFLVEIGGELRLQGLRPDGKGWTVAIAQPQDTAPAAYARINSRGAALALAGSGDYRNYREVDGRRYSHTLDPRTGAPVTHALASVTVIGDTAAAADAWATALMVLGPEEGIALADSEGLAAYFIMRAPAGFEHAHTAGFARYLADGPAHPIQALSTTPSEAAPTE